MPSSKRPWLPQSANEWIASASIADEPVYAAPALLARAMAKLAPSAYSTDFSESALSDMAQLPGRHVPREVSGAAIT